MRRAAVLVRLGLALHLVTELTFVSSYGKKCQPGHFHANPSQSILWLLAASCAFKSIEANEFDNLSENCHSSLKPSFVEVAHQEEMLVSGCECSACRECSPG